MIELRDEYGYSIAINPKEIISVREERQNRTSITLTNGNQIVVNADYEYVMKLIKKEVTNNVD